MDEQTHYIGLFQYGHWATGLILDAVAAAERSGVDVGRMLDLLSHTLRAEQVWLGRLLETEDAQKPFWHRDTLAACRARHGATTAAWMSFLNKQDPAGFARVYTYHNSKGIACQTALREVATHLINHGTHHRSQIALLLRDAGHVPPPTDYIYYTRR